MNQDKKVITRFAPSPTGKAHAGSYRTAMYAWLFARHNNGEFILRIEDTDKERNDKESEDDILKAMEWLGLTYDHFYRQSENLPRHRELLKKLIEEDRAYISTEPGKNDPSVMKDIIRLRNPNKVVSFVDHIRGDVSVDTTDLGDFVIARSIDEPLYHLAVVIDDHDEGVTHVVRAEEHIANTPRQILIIEALGWDIPEYAHLPIVLGSDKQKLSKRKGALPVTEYAKLGYLPDAVFNSIAMIGWNPAGSGTQEIFSREELIKVFDLTKIQKGSAVFNEEKLRWFNKEYIKLLKGNELTQFIRAWLPTVTIDSERFERAVPSLIERIEVGRDLKEMDERGELAYLNEAPHIETISLYLKGEVERKDATRIHLEEIIKILSNIEDNDFTTMSIKSAVEQYSNTITQKGEVLHPYRYALSGLIKSPDPFTLSYILGKAETLNRLKSAVSLISQ